MEPTKKYFTDKADLENRIGDDYYVYVVMVDWEVRYVGKGKLNRYLHPLSGTSSCAAINKAFFDGKFIEVSVLYAGLDNEAAKFYEKALMCDCVRKGATLFNKVVETDYEHYTISDEPLCVQLRPSTDVCVNFVEDEVFERRQWDRLSAYLDNISDEEFARVTDCFESFIAEEKAKQGITQ